MVWQRCRQGEAWTRCLNLPDQYSGLSLELIEGERCDAQLKMASATASNNTAPASNKSLLGSASLPCRMISRVMPVMAISTGSVTGTLWVA